MKEKDIRPIILYVAVFLGIQIVGTIIINLTISQNNINAINKALSAVTITSYIITFITFVIMYYKELIEKIKKLTKKDYLFIFIIAAVLLVTNKVLTSLLISNNIEMTNQDMVSSMFDYYTPFMIASIVVFAPLVEELLFRYSISTLIKNDIIFVIISSSLFGILHGIGLATFIYVIMGIILAICYLKTNRNVIASTIIHIINNAFGVISLLILVK